MADYVSKGVLVPCLLACGVGIGTGYGLKLASLPEKSPLEVTANRTPSPLTLPNAAVPPHSVARSAKGEPIDPQSDKIHTFSDSDRAVMAMEWLFDGTDTNGLARGTMAHWAKRDYESASTWLSENLDHPRAYRFARGMVDALKDSDPVAALDWAIRCDDTVNAWADASVPILVTDPGEAERLLAESVLSPTSQKEVTRQWDRIVTARSQRSAQNLVSVVGAALAAGATIESDSFETLLGQMTIGVYGSGTFADSEFKISELEPWEEGMVKSWVNLGDDGVVRYDPRGDHRE